MIMCLMYNVLFVYLQLLWTILSLMPTTSHPKAIGGVCYGTTTDIWIALYYTMIHNNWPVCRGSTIMLSTQVVTVVTNHNQFNNGHAWMDT